MNRSAIVLCPLNEKPDCYFVCELKIVCFVVVWLICADFGEIVGNQESGGAGAHPSMNNAAATNQQQMPNVSKTSFVNF